MGDEPDGQRSSPGSSGPPGLPNPLASNNIKLTLPTPARGRVAPPAAPVAAEPDQDDPSAEATSSGSGEASESPWPLSSSGPATADSDFGDDVGEDFDSADVDGSPRRRPDKGIVKVLALGVAAVVVTAVVVIAFAIGQSPDAPAPQADPGKFHGAPGPAPARPQAGTPDDGPIPITVTADCPNQTPPQLAASTDPKSGYSCPLGAGPPFGQIVDVQFPNAYMVTGVQFWPGAQFTGPDGHLEWARHKVITDGQIVFDDRDRTMVPVNTGGAHQLYTVHVDGVDATSFRFTVLATTDPAAEPSVTPTMSAAPGVPDLGSIFAPGGGADGGGGDPSAQPALTSIAMWGLVVTGHRAR